MWLTSSRDDYRKTIIVSIGPAEEIITMHQEVACKHSNYFRAACDADTMGTITLNLPTVEPNTFLGFVEYSYKGFTAAGSDELNTSNNYGELIELYALAQRLGSVSLKNYGIDKLISNYIASDEPPDVENVVIAWNPVDGQSMLKRLLVDLWAATVAADALMEAYEKLPKEFVAMMFVAKGVEEPTSEKAYIYHEVDADASGFDIDFAEAETEAKVDGAKGDLGKEKEFEETLEDVAEPALDEETEELTNGLDQEDGPYEDPDGFSGVEFCD